MLVSMYQLVYFTALSNVINLILYGYRSLYIVFWCLTWIFFLVFAWPCLQSDFIILSSAYIWVFSLFSKGIYWGILTWEVITTIHPRIILSSKHKIGYPDHHLSFQPNMQRWLSITRWTGAPLANPTLPLNQTPPKLVHSVTWRAVRSTCMKHKTSFVVKDVWNIKLWCMQHQSSGIRKLYQNQMHGANFIHVLLKIIRGLHAGFRFRKP